MKKPLCLLLTFLLLFSSFPCAAAASETFTLMVYLVGTDLESDGGAATADLKEMIQGQIAKNGPVKLYVQTGGTLNWHADGITDRKAERWLVSKQGLQLMDSVGSANMGDPDVFADFLRYGFEHFPADRYGLILWDHGSGASGGLCYDELTGDSLYYPEIYAALASASRAANYKKFSFIGFDACLMASYELANHIAPFAEYMIASEELEPGSGWCYDEWLPTLAANPGVSIENLGRQIVDSFIRSLSSYSRSYSGDYGTLSLCNLTKLGALQKATEQMGASLAAQVAGGNFSSISRQRQNLTSFGEISDSASDMIDMRIFAEAFAKYDSQAASAIRAALKEVVVYSSHTSNLSGISGLSILVPYATRSRFSDYLPHYETLNLSPEYAGFIKAMANAMTGGSAGSLFNDIQVDVQSYESAQIDWFSQYAADADDYYEQADAIWNSSDDNFELSDFLGELFGEDSNVAFSGATASDYAPWSPDNNISGFQDDWYDEPDSQGWQEYEANVNSSFAQDSWQSADNNSSSGSWQDDSSDDSWQNADNNSSGGSWQDDSSDDSWQSANNTSGGGSWQESSSDNSWQSANSSSSGSWQDDSSLPSSSAGNSTSNSAASFADSVFSSSNNAVITIGSDTEAITLDNPFAGIESEYAYTIQLSQEQLDVLGKVEANLMIDISEPDFECYVELGYVQDVMVDWQRGSVYGLFDDTWATLDGQMVCLYDQIVNDRYARSLIPATVNGESTYLLVIFDEQTPEGRVTSCTDGYTDAGLPARSSTPLQPGDVVVPEYELIYWDEYGEQQYEPFWGSEIIVGEDGSIPFGYAPVESNLDYCYGFCLTDIYGDSTFTDFYVLSY